MPNLERTGLLRVDYTDLPEIAAEQELWTARHFALRDDDAGHRGEPIRILLDELRRALAINGARGRTILDHANSAVEVWETSSLPLLEERRYGSRARPRTATASTRCARRSRTRPVNPHDQRKWTGEHSQGDLMLTRLEADGFKNLLGLAVDFGPFTCIAGENGTGKSNVFDAIQFLSLLADHSLIEAAQEVRGIHGERLGDPRDLFWNGYSWHEPRMRFAAEMIVPGEVEDDFGRSAEATITFLRYELVIGYTAPAGLEKVGRLSLLEEKLERIRLREATTRLRFPHRPTFRGAVLRGRRSSTAFISTKVEDGQPIVSIHQDGGSRGQPKRAAASRAPATVVSTVTSNDDPTILAARREMQSWRRLALEPSALRTADRYVDDRAMAVNGRHLAAALFRVANRGEPADPDAVYARVSGRLADLAGIHVRDLRIDQDDVRELLTIQLTESSGLTLPARSLSEGTLRFLALCVLLEDPTVTGLICMEEPENGIHPANMEAMVRLVQDLAVDPQDAPGEDNPFRQVVINTHSPAIVQLVEPGDLLFADTAIRKGPEGSTAHALRLQPVVGTWRARGHSAVTRADILPYLTTHPGAQLSLGDTA